MKKTILIIGGKSTALEIFDVIETHFKNDFKSIVFVIGDQETMASHYCFIKDSELDSYVKNNDCCYIVAFTNQTLRQHFVKLMEQLEVSPINVIHPSAIISQYASIGIGNYIAAGAIVSSNAKINNFNIINFNSTIGHDSELKNHVMVNPGAKISGNVKIGERVLIGANAFVFQGKSVGDDCLIDAMTYVDKDLENNMICSSKQLKVFKRIV